MDPMLLVANRSFQDMRDAADRERLLRANAPDRPNRLRAAFGRLVSAFRRQADEHRPVVEAPAEYEHPLLDPDGTVCLVEASDGATARSVHSDAHRIDLRAVRAGH